MNTRRLRTFTAPLLLCSIFMSPIFVERHAVTASTRDDATKAAGSYENPFVFPTDPEATYQGARIVHNVTVNGEKGMRVHANFTVKYTI